jgi:hypothetical protein
MGWFFVLCRLASLLVQAFIGPALLVCISSVSSSISLVACSFKNTLLSTILLYTFHLTLTSYYTISFPTLYFQLLFTKESA